MTLSRLNPYQLLVAFWLLAGGCCAHCFAATNLSRYTKPNDGLDDTGGLRSAIRADAEVTIGPGVWDFKGPLLDPNDAKLMAAYGRCHIDGPANESAAQHQEEGRKTDRFVSQLRVTGLKPGQYWADWKPGKLPTSAVDRGGPMSFANTSIVIVGDGAALSYGDFDDARTFGGDLRKLDLSGLYVSALNQLATADFDGVKLPSYSHDAMIRFRRGYDVTIRDLGMRGGGAQLLLEGCDRPRVDRFHGMHCVTGVAVTNLKHAAVPAALTDIFVEDYIGTGVYAAAAQCDLIRTEAGFGRKIGRRKIGAPWTIEAKGDRVTFAQASSLKPQASFFPGQVVFIDADTPLIVDRVDADGFTFIEARSHCYFAEAQSGDSLDACYGVGIVGTGDRFSLGQWSTDFNVSLPGLPVAAFAPQSCTMPIGPYSNGQSNNLTAGNRSIIVAHCAGAQHAVEASVHYANSMMAADHPLVHRGIGPVPDRNVNRWLGVSAANNEALKARFRRVDGKWTVGGKIVEATP